MSKEQASSMVQQGTPLLQVVLDFLGDEIDNGDTALHNITHLPLLTHSEKEVLEAAHRILNQMTESAKQVADEHLAQKGDSDKSDTILVASSYAGPFTVNYIHVRNDGKDTTGALMTCNHLAGQGNSPMAFFRKIM